MCNGEVAALESHRSHHGELPPALEDLVPRYLPKLEPTIYASKRSREWPHKLFNGQQNSAWAYKISRDRKNFTLAVEAMPWFYYDSRTSEWESGDRTGFAAYDKATTSTSAP